MSSVENTAASEQARRDAEARAAENQRQLARGGAAIEAARRGAEEEK